ncbi:hypothetical protein UP09_03095 [Bradyrhizobium sp. LTSP885]|uniref:hypothetical protein n=1 Tax=Bradyrhizobium sp. LTSP885 TaxID=1619232 RepID=UPI0005C93872|nr:hypothetical protein [Bradyrhizobium sp. LTSP885]KJC51051.1 hypothetical protein UP09_03095 [Bradyrhizobium sp. LTSP885]
MNVLDGKLSVTNSPLNNSFEHPSKLSAIFKARRFNFRLDGLGVKGMRQLPAQQRPACKEPRRSRQAFSRRAILNGYLRGARLETG